MYLFCGASEHEDNTFKNGKIRSHTQIEKIKVEHKARSQTHLDLNGVTQIFEGIIEGNLRTPKIGKKGTSSIFKIVTF